MPSPIHTLPPGYIEVKRLVLTEGARLLWLNILSLLPVGVALLLLVLWAVIIAPLRPAVTPTESPLPWWLSVIIVLVIVLPLHELLHGVAIQLTGHKARYGMKLDKGVLYATSENALFRRDEYLFVALLPLVGITLAGLVGMIFASDWLTLLIVMGVVLNAGGAIGDIWSSALLLRYPRRVLVRDEADGFRIYDRQAPAPLTGAGGEMRG